MVTTLGSQLSLQLTALVLRVADPTPEPEDVKAGWPALGLFLLLVGFVIFLFFSLVKRLRNVETARKTGVYGDTPKNDGTQGDPATEPAAGPAIDPARERGGDPSGERGDAPPTSRT
ncbi:hypothetical protein [Nocardioides kribbensis]|uniref:hypothetical protein n=1 Tax=Nocardioides kribbensis TaxID=305517 RepID=UPI0032DBB7F1